MAVIAAPAMVTTACGIAIPVEASRTMPITAVPGGLIMRVAVFVTVPAVAVIVAVVAVPTTVVEIVNVAVVAP
jgi:hypothetical protein